MHRIPCSATILVLIAPVLAVADSPAAATADTASAPNKRPAFAQLLNTADANGDKRLDLAEIHSAFPKFPQERFTALDKNNDGALDASEMPRRKDAKAPASAPAAPAPTGDRAEIGKKMRAADTDNDGRIAPAEYAAAFPKAPAERFAAMDRNSDGFLDRSDRELAAAAKQENAERAKKKGADGGGKAASDPETVAYLDHLIQAHDQNKDGKLTKEELEAGKPGFPGKSFAALDRDKDGVLSQADAPRAGA